MQIVDADAGQLGELIDAADTNNLGHVLGGPDGDGSAPEAVARDGPIARVDEPVVETSLLDLVGDPVGLVVVGDDLVADLLDLDEPRGHGLVDEGGVGPPAEGVGVIEVVLLNEAAGLLEELDEGIVGVLDVLAGDGGDLVGEATVPVDGAGQILALGNDAVGEADAVIVLAKGRGLVDDARTGVVGNVGVGNDAEVLVGTFGTHEEVKDGLVLLPDEVGTLHALQNFKVLSGLVGLPLLLVVHDGIELGKPSLGQDVLATGLLVLDLDVVHGGMDTKGNVGRESPGGGRPSHERHRFVIKEREVDHNGRIPNVLVVQTSLEVGQGSTARHTKGHDLVSLVDEILVEELTEDPPNTLHEGRVHGLVVVLEVDPSAEAGDGRLPLLGVPRDDGPARLVVLVDAHLQYLIAVGDVELLVDLVLDGEAVAVPPGPALDVLAGHDGVAGHDVLDGAGKDVAVMGQAGGEGRAVVEGELLL